MAPVIETDLGDGCYTLTAVTKGGERVGAAFVSVEGDVSEMVYIGVRKGRRRRGWGKKLFRSVELLSEREGAKSVGI